MTDLSFASKHAYRFDWMTTPSLPRHTDGVVVDAAVLNDRKYKSPLPCKHGNNCYWTHPETGDGCGFVHPGEEGYGRVFFESRELINTDEEGKHSWTKQDAVVRLAGASFYERRRTGLSWPEWREKQAACPPSSPVKAAARAPAAPKAIAYGDVNQFPPLSYAYGQQNYYQPPAPAPSDPARQALIAQWTAMYQAGLLDPASIAVARAACRDTIQDAIRDAPYIFAGQQPPARPPTMTYYSFNHATGQVDAKHIPL